MRYNRKTLEISASNDTAAISTADMKAFLRVSGSADDSIIDSYIATATEAVKQHCRRAILTETFVFRCDGFAHPDGDNRLAALGAGTHTVSIPHMLGGGQYLDLPFPPVVSVASVVTYDRANASSTFSADNYTLDGQSGRIFLDDGVYWPTDLRDRLAVQVTYDAGYGSGSIPPPILQAIRLMVQAMYDGCADYISPNIAAILGPYRLADELAW